MTHPIDASALKQWLGKQLAGKWATTGRSYIGFFDQAYCPVPRPVWDSLVSSIPPLPAGYLPEIFDCDDIAMQFKSFTSSHHATDIVLQQRFPSPLAIGIASGSFSWMPSAHAANFVILDEPEGLLLAWFDLAAYKAHMDPTKLAIPAGELNGELTFVIL